MAKTFAQMLHAERVRKIISGKYAAPKSPLELKARAEAYRAAHNPMRARIKGF